MLGLSARIGTIPYTRHAATLTAHQVDARHTVLCCAVGSVLASQRHMHTVDFKLFLCVKITLCVAFRQVGNNFLFIDIPARHHSAFSTNLWQ